MKPIDCIKKYSVWVIILSLSIIILFQKCKNNKLSDQVQLSNVELSTYKDSVTIFKSKNGELTSKISSVQVESDNRKAALEKAGFDIKALKDQDIKWRQVVSALQMQLESSGTGSTTLRDTIFLNSVDTVKQANFDWTNKYLTLSGNIFEKKMDFRYNYRTPIQLITEQKGKSYVVSATIGDPNAMITTGNSIAIVPKKKWFGWRVIEIVGAFAGGIFIAK